MEYYCIEARALKSSFLSSQMGGGVMKTGSQQAVPYDDVWCFAGGNNNNHNNNNKNNNVVVGTCDDFPVEELLNLDFNEKEFEGGCLFPGKENDGDEVAEKKKISSSTSSCSSGVLEDDLSVVGELAVPLDDLENLEWLSQFVDDSTSNLSTLLCPLDSFTQKTGSNTSIRSEKPVRSNQTPHFPLPFPRKPRSKRSRSSGRPWSFSSQPLIAADSSSSSSSLSSNSSSTFPMIHDYTDGSENPPVKKHKRKLESSKIGLASIGRRCTHCQVQKTPQWRTGPLGPKTLCNACGVRYKSGRLFPEYLPACSPLFSQEVHSNSHRKVLELRKKKLEMVGSVLAEPALARVVSSC